MSINKNEVCPICFIGFQKKDKKNTLLISTPCKHIYHEECLQSWLCIGNITCPLCRSFIFDDDFVDFVNMFHIDLKYALHDVSNNIQIMNFLHTEYKGYTSF